MKKYSLLTGTLLVLAPIAALLPGCGGGSSDGISPTPTSTTTTPTTATETPTSLTPTATSGQGATQTSKFYLVNGQKGIFNFTPSGDKITGTVEMLNSKVIIEGFKTRAFSKDIAPGSYTFEGKFIPGPKYYDVTATRKNATSFRMMGNLPTPKDKGRYDISIMQGSTNEYESGNLLPIGEDFPISAPKATPTPVAFDSVEPELTFKASSDSNFVEYQPDYADITPGGTKQNVTLSFATSGGSRIYGLLKNAKQGKVYTPTSSDISTLPILTNYVGDEQHLYTFQGGTIKVTILTKAFARLTFENTVFAPKVGDAGGAKGQVTVNGIIGGPINGDFIGD